MHSFAAAAGIKLAREFSKVTPDFLVSVPWKAKSNCSFPFALFPTLWGKQKRPTRTQIEGDMLEVVSPPESPLSSPEVSPSESESTSATALKCGSEQRLHVLFEITTSLTCDILERKLDQIEFCVEYLTHEQLMHKESNSSSSSSTKVTNMETLLEQLTSMDMMCGFGVPSLEHCQLIKKILDSVDAKTRPCVAHLHATGNLYFFVCFLNPHAVAASNSSSLSSLTRRLERIEVNVETGQKQLEAKVETLLEEVRVLLSKQG